MTPLDLVLMLGGIVLLILAINAVVAKRPPL